MDETARVTDELRPLRLIGYWSSDRDADWPDPRTKVDPTWDSDEREGVCIYLRHGLVARAYIGPSTCRLCGSEVGNLELTDGEYVWPEGLAHYVGEHAVRLPHEFIEHTQQIEQRLESLKIDREWWRSQGAM